MGRQHEEGLVVAEYKRRKRLAGDRDVWRRFVEEARERCGQSCHGIIRRRLPNCLSESWLYYCD